MVFPTDKKLAFLGFSPLSWLTSNISSQISGGSNNACLKERRRWSCGKSHPQTGQFKGRLWKIPWCFKGVEVENVMTNGKSWNYGRMFHCLVGLPKNLLVSLSDCISCQFALENDPGSGDFRFGSTKLPAFKILSHRPATELILKLSCLLMTLSLEFEWHGNFHCRIAISVLCWRSKPHLLHVEIRFFS